MINATCAQYVMRQNTISKSNFIPDKQDRLTFSCVLLDYNDAFTGVIKITIQKLVLIQSLTDKRLF